MSTLILGSVFVMMSLGKVLRLWAAGPLGDLMNCVRQLLEVLHRLAACARGGQLLPMVYGLGGWRAGCPGSLMAEHA